MTTLPLPEFERTNLALDFACRECDGTGRTYSPAWVEWNQRYNRHPQSAGPEPDGPEELECEGCHGIGWRPTEAGSALLEFFDRYRPRP